MRKRPERAFPFLRGCAGMSDRRERKATQACSTGRRAASPGLGGTPTGVLENPKRIFQYIARRRYYRKFLIWNSELSGVARRRKAPTPEHVEAMSDNSLERSRGNRRSSYGENMFRILAG